MDSQLLEAFFAFYWLSRSRQFSIGMSGAAEFMIQLSEIKCYYEIFSPQMELGHFIRVVRAADNEYMTIQAEAAKRREEAKPKR